MSHDLENMLYLPCSEGYNLQIWTKWLQRHISWFQTNLNAYLEGLPPIKSHSSLITWTMITWFHYIFTNTVFMTTELGRMVTCLEGLPCSHMLWSRDLARSRDKQPLCFHYHSVWYHQTWQNGDLPWEAPSHKVTWSWQSKDHMTV